MDHAAAPELELFYDGHCPLCSREVAVMRRADKKGRLVFTDIAAPGFEPPPGGPDVASFNARIQARRLADGTWIEGVDVFRHAWGALGWRWLMPFTRLPGIRQALDVAYDAFAKNRMRLTGRCDDGACRVAPSPSGRGQPASGRPSVTGREPATSA